MAALKIGEPAKLMGLDSSKELLPCDSFVSWGANGADIFFCSRSDQFIPFKNGCLLSSSAPSSPPPKRFRGSLTNNLEIE